MFNRYRRAAVISASAVAIFVAQQAFYGLNDAPVMGALSPVSGAVAEAIAITGECTDDGKPADPGAVAYLWSVDSDTGTTCIVAAPSSATTTVSSATPGSCSLRLTCCDVAFSGGSTCPAPGLSDTDTLTATVTPAGEIGDVLESYGYTVRGAFSRSSLLFAGYAGSLVTVRRVSDSATQGIGASGDALNTSALATFCGASDCFVVTTHNQDGSGNDLTQVTTTRQPKIYDGTTGTIVIGALAVSEHVSTASTDSDNLGTASHQLGFAGNPSITLYASGAHSDVTTYRRGWAGVGGAALPDASFGIGFAEPSGNLGATISYLGLATGNPGREFTPASAASTFSYVIAQSPGFANANSIVMRQNGVLLTESASRQDQRTALGTNEATIGANIGANNFGSDAHLSTEIFVEGYVTGEALAALVAFGDQQLTSAGVTPPAHDLTDAPAFIIQAAGQSNAGGLGVPATVPVDYGPHWVTKVAQGGTALDPYWIPGGARYLELEAALLALDPDLPIVVWWVQGESDAADSALSSAYLANMQSIYTALTTSLGRQIYWCDTLLHSSGVATYRDVVNTAKTDYVTWLGAYGTYVDPSSHGALTDGTHWEAALYAAMPAVAVAEMKATWFQ